MLQVTSQNVHEVVGRPGFPKPTAILGSGPIWDTGAVERWIESDWAPLRTTAKLEPTQILLEGDDAYLEALGGRRLAATIGPQEFARRAKSAPSSPTLILAKSSMRLPESEQT